MTTFAESLLLPRIAAHVVTSFFPETRCVFRHELNRSNPFRTFPPVSGRHNESKRPAVIRCQIGAIMAPSEYDVVSIKYVNWKVCCIAAVTMNHYKPSRRLRGDMSSNFTRAHPFPFIIQTRPFSYAVKVGSHFYSW